MNYPAHKKLQEQVNKHPGLWHGTIYDTGGRGSVLDMVKVLYKELLNEYDDLTRKLEIAVNALGIIESTQGGGAMKYITESASMRLTAQQALNQINNQPGDKHE